MVYFSIATICFSIALIVVSLIARNTIITCKQMNVKQVEEITQKQIEDAEKEHAQNEKEFDVADMLSAINETILGINN